MIRPWRAGSSGRVISVEADLWLASLLNRSAAMQPSSSAPIQVLAAAAWDESSIASSRVAVFRNWFSCKRAAGHALQKLIYTGLEK